MKTSLEEEASGQLGACAQWNMVRSHSLFVGLSRDNAASYFSRYTAKLWNSC
ncbi:hypothetical protein DPMN_109617 [Dreissena polymorpha]|uniref:Uncharacterized protein n=1 Tax=Dreissena polymorpha TaxID=45954 RepID=A0A9D4KBD0_DREPO|nr:hypothetical protein DPMN_109617 [Dreissena polymorpha]